MNWTRKTEIEKKRNPEPTRNLPLDVLGTQERHKEKALMARGLSEKRATGVEPATCEAAPIIDVHHRGVLKHAGHELEQGDRAAAEVSRRVPQCATPRCGASPAAVL
jgi:hypothetical protein